MTQVLAVRGLTVDFPTASGARQVVAGVDFDLHPGRTLGVVGESGCGKTLSALAVMGLVPRPGRVGGSVVLEGREMLGQPQSVWRSVRGARVAMVFQEPMTALNPVMPVGRQIAEVMVLHQDLSWHEAGARAVDALAAVGIASPRQRAAAYPHQLSGGMRQRVMIAMALACRPALLIADEPHDGAGCDDPGADSRSDAGAAGRNRHGDAVHQPQPCGHQRDRARDRRDVCRTGGRACGRR